MSGASEHERFDERDEELERLCGLVRDLELEVRGRRRGRDHDFLERKGLLVGEVATEPGHISPVPFNTGSVHVRGSMQIGTRFPRKSDNPRILPWTP